MPEPKLSVAHEDDEEDTKPKAAEVVSLDSFRK
jgi:hypothetical protein